MIQPGHPILVLSIEVFVASVLKANENKRCASCIFELIVTL